MATGDIASLLAPSNPVVAVIQAFEKEHARIVQYVKKRGDRRGQYSKTPFSLFDLWNNFSDRLPVHYLRRKLVETGEEFLEEKETKLAHDHFVRYRQLIERNASTSGTEEKDFFAIFFPDQGLNDDSTTLLTIRAIYGECVAKYEILLTEDPRLEANSTLVSVAAILERLKDTIEVAASKEKYCWLLYNGTIYTYTMCRTMMKYGHSAKVLEYLLWAAVAMESSVALLCVKYLTWRVTLYVAVCQAYYDVDCGSQAELYARRCLSKVNELAQLEHMSSDQATAASEKAFKSAAKRLGIMIFKRSVFEMRKKPKGVFRPKTKAIYKEAVQLPWPRTQSERYVSSLFDCKPDMLMAINEALAEPQRRTLLTSPPFPKVDPEFDYDSVHDVYGELFFAGSELSMTALGHNPNVHTPWPGNVGSESAFTYTKEDEIPLAFVVQFVKTLYNYEQWDSFFSLAEPTLQALQGSQEERHLSGMKAIELLLVVENARSGAIGGGGGGGKSHGRKKNSVHDALLTDDFVSMHGLDAATATAANLAPPPPPQPPAGKSTTTAVKDDEEAAATKTPLDELLKLGNTILSCTTNPYAIPVRLHELDLLTDSVLYLWSRCRPVFQRLTTSDTDTVLTILHVDDSPRWIQLLASIYASLTWLGMATIDLPLYVEVTMKLALVLEGIAGFSTNSALARAYRPIGLCVIRMLTRSPDFSAQYSYIDRASEEATSDAASRLSIFQQIERILANGLSGIKSARDVAQHGKIYAETYLNYFRANPVSASEDVDGPSSPPASGVVQLADMACRHAEFIFVLDRIRIRVAMLSSNKTNQADCERALVKECRKDVLAAALMSMQLGLLTRGPNRGEKSISFFKDSLELIKKGELLERRFASCLCVASKFDDVNLDARRVAPPEPLVVYQTDTMIVLRPAPYQPQSGEKVTWYRLFGREATGPNAKVRLNDYHLSGLGGEISASSKDPLIYVKGLESGVKYLFALAAYNECGKLIGKSIGSSTKPILAAYPIPILTIWGYLAQAAYQAGVLDVSKQAAKVLWNHFVEARRKRIHDDVDDVVLNEYRLDQKSMAVALSHTLRQLVQCIFILTDVSIREGRLFCDQLCVRGPLHPNHMARIRECERMLVALQLCGELNDAHLCLQVVVQCYGLLAPILHYKVAALPALQVLTRCHSVLQEFPSAIRNARRIGYSGGDALQHVAAVITHYIGNVLRSWLQRSSALSVMESGKRLLNVDPTSQHGPVPLPSMTPSLMAMKEQTRGAGGGGRKGGIATTARKRSSRVGSQQVRGGNVKTKSAPSGSHDVLSSHLKSDDLKALEAVLLQLSTGLKLDEVEISGAEDPSILYSVIATLPSVTAYKEVAKFRRRTRFLEFFVRVAQKALIEGEREALLEWSDETFSWLARRNDTIVTPKMVSIRKGEPVTLAGDQNKYVVALEDHLKKPEQVRKGSKKIEPKRRSPTQLRQLLRLAAEEGGEGGGESKIKVLPKEDFYERTAVRTPVFKKADKKKRGRVRANQVALLEKIKVTQDDILMKAKEVLQTLLPNYWRTIHRRRKLRSISSEEMPWRAQLNVLLALSHFGSTVSRIDTRRQHTFSSLPAGFETAESRELDSEWFALETVGILISGWNEEINVDGKPTPAVTILPAVDAPVTAAAVTAFPSLTQGETAVQPVVVTETTAATQPEPGSAEQIISTPATRLGQTSKEEMSAPSRIKYRQTALQRTYVCFRRAIVLAHRGRSWTLLQNVCRTMRNSTRSLLSRIAKKKSAHGEHGMTVENLRADSWRAFYCAADCLLDMLVQLEEGSRQAQKTAAEEKAAMETMRDQAAAAKFKEKQKERERQQQNEKTAMTGEDVGAAAAAAAASSVDTSGGDETAATALSESQQSSENRKTKSQSIAADTSASAADDRSRSTSSCLTTTIGRSVTLPFTLRSSDGDETGRRGRTGKETGLSEDGQAAMGGGAAGTATMTANDEDEEAGAGGGGGVPPMTTHNIPAAAALSAGFNLFGGGENGWVGGAEAEDGGASLHFEDFLDDKTTVDLQSLKSIVLQSFQLLFYEQQWEKLVALALSFNTLTRDRYAEQVVPLLVVAQKRLASRAASIGDVPSSSENISAGAHIDPVGHEVYDRRMALKLVSVPLSVSMSLDAMERAYDSMTHSSRSLIYCRRLLVRYLAGHTAGYSILKKKKKEIDDEGSIDDDDGADTVAIDPPSPFLCHNGEPEEIECNPLSESQLSVIVAAYDRTIESLLVKKKYDLAVQAMHELGNVHYNAGDVRRAFKNWAEALDTLLQVDDCINDWRRSAGSPDRINDVLLERCGIWGCLLGGILASKIAEFVLFHSLERRLAYTLMSTALFKSVFRASLAYPSDNCDFAFYVLESRELIPGLDLFSDRFRCDSQTLLAALKWNIQELISAKQYMKTLPLLTLYSYVAGTVCRNLQELVQARLWKIESLTELRYFSEALQVYSQLLHGHKLPQVVNDFHRQPESKMISLRFSNGLPLTDPTNFKVMTHLFEKSLSPSLATLYGPHLTTALALAQARLQVVIASTIPGLPKCEDEPTKRTTSAKVRSSSAASVTSVHKSTSKQALASTATIGGRSLSSVSQASLSSKASRIFKKAKTIPSLETIKGTFLEDAEHAISAHMDVLLGSYSDGSDLPPSDHLTPSEVELTTRCLLELSAIANEHYHSLPAARYASQALHLLQTAPSRCKEQANGYLSQTELDAHRRLDARLWLRCREALVSALSDKADARFLDDNIRVAELGSLKSHCTSGLEEAKAFGDDEMAVKFQFYQVVSNLSMDKEDESLRKKLSDLVSMATNVVDPSFSCRRLHVVALLLLGDMKGVSFDALEQYRCAEKIVFELMRGHGESIVRDELNTSLASLRNIYLPSLRLVANLKLRLGVDLARKALNSPDSLIAAEKSIFVRQVMQLGNYRRISQLQVVHQPVRPNAPPPAAAVRLTAVETASLGGGGGGGGGGGSGERPNVWCVPAVVLSAGLDVARVMAEKDGQLESVLGFFLGICERHLALADGTTHREAVNTLLEAVQSTVSIDFNLRLMAKSYLEVALTYLDSSNRPIPENLLTATAGAAAAGEPNDAVTPTPTAATAAAASKNRESKSERVRKERVRELEKERLKEKLAAWIAIRSAYVAGQCDAAVASLFASSQQDSSCPQFNEFDAVALPDFAKMELRGDDGLHFRNINDVSPPAFEANYHCYVRRPLALLPDLKNIGWASVLRYVSVLRLSLAALSTSLIPDVIASPLASRLVTRLLHLRIFLLERYSPYASAANAPTFVKALHLPYTPLAKLQNTTETRAGSVLVSEPQPKTAATTAVAASTTPAVSATTAILLETVAEEEEEDEEKDVDDSVEERERISSMPPTGSSAVAAAKDGGVSTCADNEICFQWYRPILGGGTNIKANHQIVCLYAINVKGGRALSYSSKLGLIVGQRKMNIDDVTSLSVNLRKLLAETESKQRTTEMDPGVESEAESVLIESESSSTLDVAVSKPETNRKWSSGNSRRLSFSDCLVKIASLMDMKDKSLSTQIKVEPSVSNLKSLLTLFHFSGGGALVSGATAELVKFFKLTLS